ncbi:MAG: terminase small subunit [Pseudomonadota bacterium]
MSQTAEAVQKPLNPRQRQFALELATGEKPLDAQEKAGFKPHRGNAARLAADPRVQAIVETAGMEAARLAGVHLGRVLVEQARIAYFNIGELLFRDARGQIVLDKSGMPIIDYSAMTNDHLAAVAKIDFEKGKIEFHDKVGVLRDLMKYLNPNAEKDKPPGGDTFVLNQTLMAMVNKFDGMSDTDIARRVAFTLQLGQRAMKNVTPSADAANNGA